MTTGADPAPAAPPRVLVVDDDPRVGRLVRLTLEMEGIAVVAAATLAEARPLLEADLRAVVLDRRLPDGDGLDLLADLAERCPDVPVVVFSALDADDREPPGVRRVPKSDVGALFEALGLAR